MLVYRFEHPEHGQGPFQVLPSSRWTRRGVWGMTHVHAQPFDYPDAIEDHLPMFGDDDNRLHFGCPTLVELLDWFRRPRALFLAGFRLYVYDCPDECVHTGKSGKQVVFERNQAEIVAEIQSVAELANLDRELEAYRHAEAA